MQPTTIQLMALCATIALAFVGYAATYWNNVRLETRRARFAYVSSQLKDLYGPLFSLTRASNLAWGSFRSRCRPGGSFFGRDPPPTEDDLKEWRHWMTTVFMPMNLQMERAIVENAHLIDSAEMPQPFLDFISHVEVYKAVIAKWEQGDVSQHLSYLNFPPDFAPHVEQAFHKLVAVQARYMS